MAEKKEKQYVSDNAQLMAEWNWEKNNELAFDPRVLTVGSERKVWWRCSSGHEWQASINSRKRGNGCPYCAGRLVIQGENDLQTVSPSLSSEWNYDKNDELTPMDVMPNSSKTVWWICRQGHEWQAKISNRNNGKGCPYCSGRYVIQGKSDLLSVNPDLAKEWNYDRNGSMTPENTIANCHKKVWWKCRKGHEWLATVANRNYGRGCPVCSLEQNTSFPEYAFLYYLDKCGLPAMHLYKEMGYELDIYIPSHRTAIEYDGYLWHKNSGQRDLEKNRKCEKDGIRLFRVREGLSPLNDSSFDFVVQKDQNDLAIVITVILHALTGITTDVNLQRDAIAIENLREHIEKGRSFLSANPNLVKEWHCEKNGSIKPEYFAANSRRQVWWKCPKGHEWIAAIADRNKGNGCPYCSGQRVLQGYNDLQTINPILAAEWNYAKNEGLKPEVFTASSNKEVWWICEQEHEWQAKISNRNNGKGCPYCSGRYAVKGKTDLQTINPTLAKEWNHEKNDILTPVDVKPNSHIKVWWKCANGHEWQSRIADRNRGRGCPECARANRKLNPLPQNEPPLDGIEPPTAEK